MTLVFKEKLRRQLGKAVDSDRCLQKSEIPVALEKIYIFKMNFDFVTQIMENCLYSFYLLIKY